MIVKNFPTRAPVGMLLGGLLGLVSAVPVFAVWHHSLPPLERFYLPQYLGSTLAQTPIGTVVSFFNPHRGARKYFVLMQGKHPVVTDARTVASGSYSVCPIQTSPRIFGLWMRNQIYAGRELRNVLELPIILWIAVAFSFLISGMARDFQRRKRAREGVRLRGPDLLTRRKFNRVTNGDGFSLYVRD